jgi:cob(I)alamin adenosyltransferase
MEKRGLLQVYTGDGKGKTTAALGLALRALGHGWRVAIIQFMKGDEKYGEVQSLRQFPNCQLMQYGRDVLVDLNKPDPQDLMLAQQGWSTARKIIDENTCDLLILDELNVAAALKLVEEGDIVSTLTRRPGNMEIVVTGRYAPQAIQNLADLITEMRMVRHPFEQGVPAREGIEY